MVEAGKTCCPCAVGEYDECDHSASCKCCADCIHTIKSLTKSSSPKCPEHNLPPNIKGKCPKCGKQLRKDMRG